MYEVIDRDQSSSSASVSSPRHSSFGAIRLRRVHVAAQLLHLLAHVGRRLRLEAQHGGGVEVEGEGVDAEVRPRQPLGLRGEGEAEGR